MKIFVSKYFPGIILFVFSVAVCLLTFKDRGVGWDESVQREAVGKVTYNYVFKGDKALFISEASYYGPAFELPLIVIEKVFRLRDSQDIFQMRHLVTHLLFLVSVFFGYLLIYRLFNNNLIASIGFIMLAFMPRIYAHSFENTKDIPFLSMFLVSLFVGNRAFENERPISFLLLGAICGYTTSIRIMGVLLVLIFALFILIDLINGLFRGRRPGKMLINLGIFLSVFLIFMYITWPFLWPAPIHNFIFSFKTLAHYSPGSLLFNGRIESTDKLPWTYFPVWFCITTPLVWLFAGVAGVIVVLVSFFKKPEVYLNNTHQRSQLLHLLCFCMPVALVIMMNSSLYDDWRHLYFVYPPFVLLACFAINESIKFKYGNIVLVISYLQIIFLSVFMVKNHPFQIVYFNAFVPRTNEYIRQHYEFEYWGVSYKQGLEYILLADRSPLIKVTGGVDLNILIRNNLQMLPESDRKRFEVVDNDVTADYFITNFRWHAGDYQYTNILHDFRAFNSTFLRVYKLKQ